MRCVQNALLAAVAAIAFASVASAADMPIKAPKAVPVVAPTWAGTYIGINGGYGWGTTNHTDQFGVTTGNFSTSGGVIGITTGANWQFGKWVLGYEGDFDFADINGTLTTAGPPLGLCSVNGGNSCFTNLKNLSTDRIRVGFDWNGWLLFGTGGFGYGQVNAGQNPCGVIPVLGGNSCNQKWRYGWVAGAGIERMLAPNWSAKLEYLHYDLGSRSQYTPTIILGGNTVNVLERGDMVRAGINYHYDLFSLLH